MRNINYDRITAQPNIDRMKDVAQNELEACDYVCLSDALVNYANGGAIILEMLDELNKLGYGQEKHFRIRPIRDEWGNEVKPGDIVKRKITKPLKINGRKLSNTVLRDMRRRGTFDKKFILESKFTVEEDGTFKCGYQDAAWFLSEYGIHYKTREPLCGRRETTKEPCRAPDGTHRIVWYWRFEEAPPVEEAIEPKGKKK